MHPLIEAVPDALLLVDRDGRVAMANSHAERLFGYPADGLTGLQIERLMPVDARQRHRSHRRDYMHAPRMRPMGGAGMALVGLRRDGAQFPVEIALSPLQTGKGMCYVASIRDISETQRAKQSLMRARYDALVARIGQEAVELADEEALINRLPGLLADALSAASVVIAFLRDKPLLDIRASSGAPRMPNGPFEAPEHWQQLADGHPLVIDDLAKAAWRLPLLGGDTGSGAIVPLLDRGRSMGVLVARLPRPRTFDHDALHLLQSVANLVAAMTQRRRTEEQLAHSQRLEAIGQLTGGIAHDFNNLLTVISGNLQLLEDRCARDRENAELIQAALRSTQLGAELTRKLLAFARRQPLSPGAVSPRQLLRDLERMLRRTLGDTIRLSVDCPPDLPSVHADASQLDSALLNLVLNARDAMPDGGEIRLAAERASILEEDGSPLARETACILFSVQDTGHGMSADTLAHAIEPFFTTKPGGRGSGLGLSMAYGFARQSGGRLRIDSRPDHGTRVELYLPIAPGSACEAPSTQKPPAGGDGERVLVVEDDPAVREVALALLASLGYRTQTAGSASEALARLAQDTGVQALFSDLMLGTGMSGAELAFAARRTWPHLAILLASGHDGVPARQRRRIRDFEVLRKPYDREELAAALRRSLDAARHPAQG